ncbi:MAG: PepSY domain-containing protein, partial [Acidobacteriota bacterium]|nr:PepSY domain-containing protein [Acidobacteriota bacterium]
MWQTWLRRPQTTWLRKVFFQIHLWSGLILGLYIAVVCVSGSAVVFRNDIYDVLVEKLHVTPQDRELSQGELEQSLQRAYPGYAIRELKPGRDGDEASEVLLARGSREIRRLVNPYTGEDRGPAISQWFRIMRWISDLHGNLLLGTNGMSWNSIGGGLTALLCLTGLVVWWPGVANWRRNLTLRRGVGWKRMNWDLHSALGFWSFALVFMWGTT